METQNVVKLFMQGILGPAHLVECVDNVVARLSAEYESIKDLDIPSPIVERIESRNGTLTIEKAHALGYGTKEYELISID